MIVNNLLLKLKDNKQENVLKAQEVLLSMRGKIEVLRDVQVEVNIRHGGSSFDLILITKFDAMDDLEAYLIHPVHVEVSQYIGSVLETGASVCYETNT